MNEDGFKKISYDDILKMRDNKPLVENKKEEPQGKELKEAVTVELPVSPKIHFDSKTFTKVSCAIISVLAMCASVYYTNEWFTPRVGWIMAKIMTAIVVFTLVISPQVIGTLLAEKRRIAALIATFVMIISGGYSMMTTVGTLYDSQSESAIESASAESSLRNSEGLKDRIEELKRDKARYIIDENRYRGVLDSLSLSGKTSGAEVNTATRRLNDASTKIEVTDKKIEELQNKMYNQAGSGEIQAKADRPDFITWVSKFTPWDRRWTELLINGIPAVFVDIIAPFMLRMVMVI